MLVSKLFCAGTLVSALATIAIAPSAQAGEASAAVAKYIDGWKTHDSEKVWAAFSDNGLYKDEIARTGVMSNAIAEHVEKFKGADFEFIGENNLGSNKLDLNWSVKWPDQRGTIHYIDHLTLEGASIWIVESSTTDPVPDAARTLVDNYYSAIAAGDKQGVLDIFTPNGVYTDRLIPKGVSGDKLAALVGSRSSILTVADPDGKTTLTKDGRIAHDFIAKSRDGGHVLARGRDLMMIKDGKFSNVVGLF